MNSSRRLGTNRFSPSILEIEKYVVSYFLSGQGQSSSLSCPPIDILEFMSTRTQLELLTVGGGRVDLSPASYSFLFHLYLLVLFFLLMFIPSSFSSISSTSQVSDNNSAFAVLDPTLHTFHIRSICISDLN